MAMNDALAPGRKRSDFKSRREYCEYRALRCELKAATWRKKANAPTTAAKLTAKLEKMKAQETALRAKLAAEQATSKG